MSTLTIGQVARRADVGVETVRYYERQGLIAEPPRRESGYRQYSPDIIDRLRFIKRAQTLGFTLKEIGELLSLRVDEAATCADVKDRTAAKITDIERKIAELQRMKYALQELHFACSGRGPTSECPILDALSRQEDEACHASN